MFSKTRVSNDMKLYLTYVNDKYIKKLLSENNKKIEVSIYDSSIFRRILSTR